MKLKDFPKYELSGTLRPFLDLGRDNKGPLSEPLCWIRNDWHSCKWDAG